MTRYLFAFALCGIAAAGGIVSGAASPLAGGYGVDALSICVSADQSTLVLGEDLEILYEVSVEETGQKFDSVDITIKNKDDAVVAQWTGLDGSEGSHTVTWTGGKWNTGSHNGAFANPYNSDYTIKAIGRKSNQTKDDSTSVATDFDIEADITDKNTAAASRDRVAGLDDLLSALTIEVKPSSGSSLTFTGSSQITMTDGTGNSPPLKYVKHVLVDDSSLNSLSDGDYQVLFTNLRDAVGNFTDTDASATGVQPYKFTVQLY